MVVEQQLDQTENTICFFMHKDMFFGRDITSMAVWKHTVEYDDSTCHVHHHVSEPLEIHAAKIGA